ncbi:MAG: HlyD family type I secretion periplasmic adaptor subunit [Gammaproteobacteria bacterium]|nr:HlyD family type I secretion periplasmic adaptor subunit [Gammaproteobacteria bacterium]
MMVRPGRRQGDELEFLPAVLELQETPPSPVGRATAGVIMLLFVVGVAWAALGQMDIVAVAPGKIVPSDRSKVIQPLEAGVVRAIRVADGQRVAAGDVLIELDATAADADVARLANEAQAAALQAGRLRALLAGADAMAVPAGADGALAALQERLLVDQRNEYTARLESARLQVRERAATVAVTGAHIARLEAVLPLIEERTAAMADLERKHYGSRMAFLELEEERVDKVRELDTLRHQLERDRAALEDARARMTHITAEARHGWRAALAEHETRLRSIAEELHKAEGRRRRQRLVAPIGGVVQQLAVHTVGGVVTPAQTLMVIVPGEDRLEVEAWVENKDAGFVRRGQAAEVKVEAFPFTRYGTVAGTILDLSREAVTMEGAGLLYPARVALAHTAVEVGGAPVALAPGMNVTVEIKTGRRRLLEYFLSPLLRGLDESARER